MSIITTARRPVSQTQVERFGAGRVLAAREANGYHDSDFYALVARPQEDGSYRFGWEESGSTRYPGPMLDAVPDASEEVLEAYRAARKVAVQAAEEARREAQREVVEPGKRVIIREPVSRGPNKTEAGIEGEVQRIFRSTSRHGTWERPARAQVRLDDGREVWLDVHRVSVVGFDGPGSADSMDVSGIAGWSWPSL